MTELAPGAAAWLLTYALHSTLLLGAAALLTARWVRAEAWRETLWQAALFGGLVTATAQALAGYAPVVGHFEMAGLTQDAASPAAAAPPADAAVREAGQPEAPQVAAAPAAAAPSAAEAGSSTPPPSATTPSTPAASWRPAPALLGVAGWMALAAALLLRLGWRQAQLRRLLRDRTPVDDPRVLGMVAELRRNAGVWRPVRVTASPAAPTPLALPGGEICLPPRFLRDLDPEQQRSALAHELAHLARRDPAWHLATGVLVSLFFFQPLNRLARRRLREAAEFRCDAWAARQTGSPLGLARCLAEVASWVAPGHAPLPAGTVAMAEGGSPLVQRVQRLLAWGDAPREASGTLRSAAAAALVLAVAAAAPAVAAVQAPDAGVRTAAAPSVQVEAAAREQEVIRHPRPSDPLAARWAWGRDEMRQRGVGRAWIAYSVQPLLAAGEGWTTDTQPVSLRELREPPLNRVLGAPDEHALILVTMTSEGSIERIAVRHAASLELGRLPVLWLGPAEPAASFAHLRALADAERSPVYREALVEAIGIHRVEGVVPYLAAALAGDAAAGVRRDAAQALAGHRTDQALRALWTAIERDRSPDVRREAVEAIGRMRHAQSVRSLSELAAAGQDDDVRRHAVEALGDAGPEAFDALRRVALGAADANVAREAVESLQNFPAARAAPLLREIAWMPGRPGVSRQAVESLARFPRSASADALREIARTHPDPGVRDEARDQLGLADEEDETELP